GRSLTEEEAEADEWNPMRFERQDMLLRREAHAPGAIFNAQQDRQTGAVDVRIEQPRAQAAPRERKRQIDGYGTLAHAALAGSDRDHMLHRGESRLLCPGIAHAARRRDGIRRGYGRPDLDGHASRTESRQLRGDRAAEAPGNTGIVSADREADLHASVAHAHVLHHVE